MQPNKPDQPEALDPTQAVPIPKTEPAAADSAPAAPKPVTPQPALEAAPDGLSPSLPLPPVSPDAKPAGVQSDIPPVPASVAQSVVEPPSEQVPMPTAASQPGQPPTTDQRPAVPPAPNTIVEPGSLPNYAPIPRTRKHNYKKLVGILLLVVIVGLAGGGYYFLNSKSRTETANNVVVKPQSKTGDSKVATNSWTGKASTYNWADAANWSLGKPSNGQNLEFDMANVKQPTDDKGSATDLTFQNNIRDLTVNKITFKGQVPSMLAGVKGEALTITGGIDDTVTQPEAAQAAIPQLQFYNTLTFKGDQTIHAAGKNLVTFGSLNGTDEVIKFSDNKTIQFVADDQSVITVTSPMNGAATLRFPKQTATPHGSYSFTASSPGLSGKVVVGSGVILQVGNRDGKGGAGTSSGLGTSAVEVQDGGTVSLAATGTESFTLANELTLSGNGAAATTKNAGATLGAVNACLTKAQEGCSAAVQVTLSGKVNLAADAQLGASFGLDGNGTPTGTTVTYTVPNIVKNGHSLTVVADSKAAIK